jgi:hypothetical protein
MLPAADAACCSPALTALQGCRNGHGLAATRNTRPNGLLLANTLLQGLHFRVVQVISFRLQRRAAGVGGADLTSAGKGGETGWMDGGVAVFPPLSPNHKKCE